MSARQRMRDTVLESSTEEEVRGVLMRISEYVDDGTKIGDGALDEFVAEMVEAR